MLQELRKQYTEATGKKPFAGWKEDKLKELIEKAKNTEKEEPKPLELKVDNEMLNRAKMENDILMKQHLGIDEPVPVHKEGVAYFVINDKYVPYWEGKVHFLKEEIKKIESQISNIEKLYL